jgi:hypothetical protein
MQLCNKDINYPLAEDELNLCRNGGNSELQCTKFWFADRRLTKNNIMCSLDDFIKPSLLMFEKPPQFSFSNYSIIYPVVEGSQPLSIFSKSALIKTMIEQSGFTIVTKQQTPLIEFQCHSGIPVYFKGNVKCFCPPSLYNIEMYLIVIKSEL